MKFVIIALLFVSSAHAISPLQTIKDEIKKNGKGIVIMDLDETVLDSHTRKYHAFLDSFKIHCGDPEATIYAPKSTECEKLQGLSKIDFYKIHNGYSMYELLARMNLTWNDFIKNITNTMIDIYMTSHRMNHDSPIPGANTYVRELKRLGAEIYFVTARYEDTMSEGTLTQLKALGFMQKGEEHYLILRKRGEAPLDFKKKALEKVISESKRKNMQVVGLFENEAENLHVWKEVFPHAHAVLIRGNMLVNVKPKEGLPIIEDYRY